MEMEYDGWYRSNESSMGEDDGNSSGSRADESPVREDVRVRSSCSDRLRVGEDGWAGWNSWSDEPSMGVDCWEESQPDESPMREDGWGSWPGELRDRVVEDGSCWPGEVPIVTARAVKRADAAGSSAALPATRAVGDVTVDDTDILDCVVCCRPLKPPIFQCEVGHVVCSLSCDKLKTSGKCHVCFVVAGGYRRCYAMEHLVESVHVRCPNEAYGCFVRPVYYDQHNHIQWCVHVPCYCPEVACDFIGSKSALWNHVSGVHSWPRSKGMASKKFDICLHDGLDVIYERMNVINLRVGYNFILVDSASDSNSHGTTYTATTSNQYLFLLNMAPQPPGHSISVLCIHPQASGDGQGSSPKEVTFELSYTGRGDSRPCGCDQVIEHYQKSRFRVACTNLSDGLTSLDACFQFVVPDYVAADNDRDTILVTARIIIE